MPTAHPTTRHALLLASALLAVACNSDDGPAGIEGSPNVTVVDLGFLSGDDQSIAYDVNGRRQVVGQSANGWTQVVRAFFWENGQIRSIAPASSLSSWARAINEADPVQIAGAQQSSNGFTWAIRWNGPSADAAQLLETEPSDALGLNDHGVVVGVVCDGCTGSGQGAWRGAVWNGPGNRVTIDPLPGFRDAYATEINNAGFIVGISLERQDGQAGPDPVAFLRLPSGEVVALPIPSGAAGTEAYSISEVNGSNQFFVAGRSITSSGQQRTVRWTVSAEGTVLQTEDMGITGWAGRVNDSGDFVGTSGSRPDAFIWRDGRVQLLAPVPNGSGTAAFGMNGGTTTTPTYVAGGSVLGPVARATLWQVE
ncbi:MAG TPA: hypothetical protein VIL13_00885 [Longimicrobiales bacterium]